MARKRSKIQDTNSGVEKDFEPVTYTPEVAEKPKRNYKKWGWLLLAVAALVLWWWKSNTWPVMAIVGTRPITRYEVEQALFKQSGEAVVDSLITQKLVEDELDKLGVVADKTKVDEQLESMKKSLPEGTKWEEEIANRGFTEKQIMDLINLQVRINQAVESQATASASEIDDFIKQNGSYLTSKTPEDKRKEAERILKQEKTGAAIESWIEKVRTDGMARVRRFGK